MTDDPLAAIRLRHEVARDVGSAYYPAEDMAWLIGEVERLRDAESRIVGTVSAGEWGHLVERAMRAEAALEQVRAIHRPSTDRGEGCDPYCVGCWEAGGMDGAPSWPCPTVAATGSKSGLGNSELAYERADRIEREGT